MAISRIITTKLEPPRMQAAVLARERLALPADWLSGGYALALLTAPAGYGKSTLLVQWLEQVRAQGGAAAWLSLDEDDEDPARFATYLAASLNAVLPEVGNAALAQLQSGMLPSLQPVLESLLADLAELDRPLCLFLDDLHLVNGEESLQLLQRLIHYAPGHVVFAIASRTRPSLSLRSLQLQGRLLEFDLEALKLAEDEARQFLRGATAANLDDATLSTLFQRTEGWPAALQLASLSLRGSEHPQATVAAFSGSDRQVCDYLAEVVLAQLSEALRRFLLQTAVLDRFCAALCTAVTGVKNSQAILEELEARNLFLIPLDRSRRWYRYHHLFRDFLRQRLAADDPDAAATLQARAAQWLYAQGLEEEAIHHALAAGDYEHAAAWIAAGAEDLVQRRGAHTTLLRWMRRLPEPYLARWPAIRMHRAWSLGFSRQFEAAERELQTVEGYRARLLEEGSEQARAEAAEIACTLELQRATFAALCDRAEESRRIGEAWLAAWPKADAYKRGAAHVVLGFAYKCNGEFERGLANLHAARSAFAQSQGHYGEAWAIMVNTVLLAKQGRHQQAMAECGQALQALKAQLGPHAHAVHMLSALMAAMHYERDELAQAEACLSGGLDYLREQSSVDPLIAGYQTLARLALHQHAGERATKLLDEGMALAEARRLPRLAATLGAELATQYVWQGELSAAQDALAAAKARWQSADDEGRALSGWALVQARIDLAGGQPQKALNALQQPLLRARRLGHGRRLVEILVLRALALQALDKPREALRTLQEALQLAAPAGYVRVFLNEGLPLQRLVEAMQDVEQDELRGHLALLASRFGTSARPAATPAPKPPAPETLTAKEAQILRMLASGHSNDEIAARLFISNSTVKWHLHNIYTKLGVRRRTAALARARSLDLLG